MATEFKNKYVIQAPNILGGYTDGPEFDDLTEAVKALEKLADEKRLTRGRVVSVAAELKPKVTYPNMTF